MSDIVVCWLAAMFIQAWVYHHRDHFGYGSANEKMCYIVTPLIGWAHTQNDACILSVSCIWKQLQ